jgi:hypothetical protein
LLYINGSSATAAKGSITVNDEDTGSITVEIDVDQTADLPIGSFEYDVKIVRTGDPNVYPLSSGVFNIEATATKSQS